MNRPKRRLATLLVAAVSLGCGSDGGTAPEDESPVDEQPVPGPGPHFSVSPIPLDDVARITPVGYNNKTFPTPHTYWDTCDIWSVMPSERPCKRERLPLRAPAAGVVRDVQHAIDGMLAVEGPPGLIWTFGHVTPAADLASGSDVAAGEVVATMTYDHGFDFGVINYAVKHEYIDSTRYHHGYLHGEHPIAQFPEPLRSGLTERIVAPEDPLGRLSYDMAGTAAGGWFIEGAPAGDVPLERGNDHMLLWFGRWVERRETRIMHTGEAWPGSVNRLLALDAAAPSWEDLTPASGAVALKMWNLGTDARPNLDWPGGTLLLQVLEDERLRVEWFDTHDPVGAFTSAARTYER